MRTAFTLIELLIVVAIIAILAAIAIPNLLDAQVRAKVARMKSDLRTIATGLECYAIDFNRNPHTTYNPTNGNWLPEEQWKFLPGALSTPVAYLSSRSALRDVFRDSHRFGSELAHQVMYLPSFFYQPPYSPDSADLNTQIGRYGSWVLRSAGPDTYYQNQPGRNSDYEEGGWNKASYDATNGTVSSGDISRSQKNADESHV